VHAKACRNVRAEKESALEKRKPILQAAVLPKVGIGDRVGIKPKRICKSGPGRWGGFNSFRRILRNGLLVSRENSKRQDAAKAPEISRAVARAWTLACQTTEDSTPNLILVLRSTEDSVWTTPFQLVFA
jgi:hypothetical protein